ncbi:MAG: winged helix-turn-helix transcriptional regulator [Zestosphaera sp.]
MKIVKDNRIYSSKECRFFDEKSIEFKILYHLNLESLSLKELSKRIGIYPQLLFHYLNKLIKMGFIIKIGKKYKAFPSYFQIILDNPEEKFSFFPKVPKFLKNFQKNEFYIVIGSPDPHGPFSARSRDNHLLFYLGQLISSFPMVKFDIDVINHNLLYKNLIVVGGPVTNMISYKLNTILKLRFLQEFNWNIYSEFSNKMYSEENIGIIYYSQNPFNLDSEIILLAGKRKLGTEITIKSLPLFLDLEEHFCAVVEGKDLDGDGYIDKIDILEINKL